MVNLTQTVIKHLKLLFYKLLKHTNVLTVICLAGNLLEPFSITYNCKSTIELYVFAYFAGLNVMFCTILLIFSIDKPTDAIAMVPLFVINM